MSNVPSRILPHARCRFCGRFLKANVDIFLTPAGPAHPRCVAAVMARFTESFALLADQIALGFSRMSQSLRQRSGKKS